MGRKVWAKAEVVNAADINTYLMNQANMTFATAAARTTAIPSPTQGMVTWRNDAAGPIKLEYYNGSAWTAFTFTAPAGTTPNLSSYASTASPTVASGTAPGSFGSWTSVGTVPAGVTHLAGIQGIVATADCVLELSLNGGTTVIARVPVSSAAARTVRLLPRAFTAGATISARVQSMFNSGSTNTVTVGNFLLCSSTPSIVTTAVETVTYITTGITGWNNLAAVSAGRLVGVLNPQGIVNSIGMSSQALWLNAEGHVTGPIGLAAGTLQVNTSGTPSSNYGTGAVVLAA